MNSKSSNSVLPEPSPELANATAPRQIVVGDVHGHYDGLMQLLDYLDLGETDEVYFLGDLVDRGPKSAQVVEFVKNSSYRCILGNHEHMMLSALPDQGENPQAWQAWLYSGGYATISSYQDAGIIPREHLQWMKTLPLYIDLGGAWLVHAGIHPTIPLTKQAATEFCWVRKEFHQIAKPYFENKLVIVGHTITFTFEGVESGALVQGQGWLGIDTGVYHARSGWLTGLDLTHQKVYQVNVLHPAKRQLPLEEAITNFKRPSLLTRLRPGKL
ncbi:MAG: serine/threonine protein phosphatase [Oscillatoriales cyanobacterium RM1_1_9]|nr:serine/threonine protein phosphatase [Oscillatoriales cyanobacterium SM2_3_0]NJO45607.1 serine/threonine protein phosphatase [Oscillatoriales cyanobacterium RM2_1_1]NJO70886.1 serine/threonine protein phosphatase [Oscillatoriales cyanobacterium RM1_1_9]